MRIQPQTVRPPVSVREEGLKHVEDFRYLGAIITKDGGVTEGVMQRIRSASGAHGMLPNCGNL